MESSVGKVFASLKERGYQVRVVSIDRLHLLQKEIDEYRRKGLFNDEFYQGRLDWFRFEIPETLPEARSMIIAAVPRPQTRAVFTWKGRRRPLVIPPTYTAYDKTRDHVENLLARTLRGGGHSLARTALPLKLLAVRSGLGEYGRNNICYVSGMGSFLQLVGVCSDMPCERDDWREAKMMETCEECDLCRRACPTAAIPLDRFLLRAERCIVYHNEKPGNVPFPDWMNKSWHNCVVGCMHCQRVCPEDRKFLQWIEGEEEFSENETAHLLEGLQRDKLQIETLGKLERLDLVDYLESLPRNLGVFFNKSK